MTTAKPKKKKLAVGISKRTFRQHLQRFIETKTMADEGAARAKKQRDALVEFVAENGIENEKGHVLMDGGDLGMAKRERRVSNVFESEYAEVYLKANKLWVACTETITVIDEDAVLVLIYDGTIPEDVGDEMYTEKVSYAFKVEAPK